MDVWNGSTGACETELGLKRVSAKVFFLHEEQWVKCGRERPPNKKNLQNKLETELY